MVNVSGIDLLPFGMSYISSSVGLPDEWPRTEVLAHLERYLRTTEAGGRVSGGLARDLPACGCIGDMGSGPVAHVGTRRGSIGFIRSAFHTFKA